MKKFLSNFLLLLMISLSFSFIISVKADIGQKPSTTIKIIGVNQSYYFDLLMKIDEDRVVELSEEEVFNEIEYYYYLDNFPNELNGFYDNDGYASYTLYRDIPHQILKIDEHTYKMTYYPPDNFKIVLVLETGEMIVSEILNKTLFDSSFTFDLSDFLLDESESEIIGGITVYNVNSNLSDEIPYLRIIMQIIIALFLTIGIELLVLFIFRYKSKSSYKLVLIVNAFTQLILHSTLIIGSLFTGLFGFIFLLIIGELIVLTLEIILYLILLKEKSKLLAVCYAIVANITSFWVGTYILSLLTELIK